MMNCEYWQMKKKMTWDFVMSKNLEFTLSLVNKIELINKNQ